MYTQRVMSEYTIWFFVILIVSATWAIMSLMIAAMLARFKAVSLAENLRLMQEKEAVSQYGCEFNNSALASKPLRRMHFWVLFDLHKHPNWIGGGKDT